MQPIITPYDTFSIAELSHDPAPTTTLYLTADIHTKNSLAYQATELLIADMLLSGSGTQSRTDILDAINATGGSIMISVEGGVFTAVIKGLTRAVPTLRTILTTILTKPTFSSTELARAKKAIINQLHEAKEDSRSRAHVALINHYYDVTDRRYSYPIEEVITAVTRVTKQDLRRLLDQIQASFFFLSIASNEKTISETKRWCTTWRRSYRVPLRVSEHTQIIRNPHTQLIAIPSRQNIDFSIGAPIPITLHHTDYVPLMFGLAVLGKWGGFTGRLMSTVREQEGLTYGIYATLEQFTGTEKGMWRIMTFFAPQKAVTGLTSTIREITNIHQHGITPDEFERFKRILATGQVLEQDSVGTQLRTLHQYHVEAFTVTEIKERKQRISSLTRAEINHALATYLNPATISICGAGPTASAQKDIKAFHKTMTH